jgi:phosphoribosyl 1,2-cyclic phosphate phosphodiesterase
VPLIGGIWGNCDPTEPKNRRRRASILVEEMGATILVDTSPDVHDQLVDAEVKDISAVFYTHAHADHLHGIDDLRSVNWMTGRPTPIYADAATMKDIRQRFPYVFTPSAGGSFGFYKPATEPHEFDGPFDFMGMRVIPIRQHHGKMDSCGFRIGDFAYNPDVKSFDDSEFEKLRGVKVWIVDCVREREHGTHAHLAQTLEWIEAIGPERAYLTHMDQSMDYATIKAKLPRGVEPAYDGLVIEI